MFNTFKKILSGSKITKEDANKVSQFMLLRWLSGDARLMPLASSLNNLDVKIDTLELCLLIQQSLSGKVKFIKFPASKKHPQEEKDDDCRLIMSFFNVGKSEAVDYWEWMIDYCPHEIEVLRKMYKVH